MDSSAAQTGVGLNGSNAWFIFNGPTLSSFGTAAANVPYFIAVSFNSSVTNAALIRLDTGQIYSETTTGWTQTPGPTLLVPTICARSSGTGHEFNGPVGPAMVSYNNFLSQDVLVQWVQRPWDFWYPPSDVEAELVGTIASSTAGEGSLMQMGIGQ
jgi:hypothetical protein